METFEQYLERTEEAGVAAHVIAETFVKRIMEKTEAENGNPDIVHILGLMVQTGSQIVLDLKRGSESEPGRAYQFAWRDVSPYLSGILGRVRYIVTRYVSEPDEIVPLMATLDGGITERDVWYHVVNDLLQWARGATLHLQENPDHTPKTCAVAYLIYQAYCACQRGELDRLPESGDHNL